MSQLQVKTITHVAVVELIVNTLKAEDGAGSDLEVGKHFGEWLEVKGNLDVHHLASDMLLLVEQAKAEALREAARELQKADPENAVAWLRARAATVAPDVTP